MTKIERIVSKNFNPSSSSANEEVSNDDEEGVLLELEAEEALTNDTSTKAIDGLVSKRNVVKNSNIEDLTRGLNLQSSSSSTTAGPEVTSSERVTTVTSPRNSLIMAPRHSTVTESARVSGRNSSIVETSDINKTKPTRASFIEAHGVNVGGP